MINPPAKTDDPTAAPLAWHRQVLVPDMLHTFVFRVGYASAARLR
jgi:hypothetical protein